MDSTTPGAPFPRRVPTSTGPEAPPLVTDDASSRDLLGDLLRAAGPRQPAPAERALRVRAAVHEEWRDMLRTRLRHRRQLLGVAALLATAAAVVLTTRGSLPGRVIAPPPPAAIIATLEAGSARLGGGAGAAELTARGGAAARDAGRPLAVGAAITAGSVIRTPDGAHAALRLGGGTALRLDERTTVVIESDHELRLEAGALYADTGDALAASTHMPLRIQTPYGIVRDIGTRFEIRLLPPIAAGASPSSESPSSSASGSGSAFGTASTASRASTGTSGDDAAAGRGRAADSQASAGTGSGTNASAQGGAARGAVADTEAAIQGAAVRVRVRDGAVRVDRGDRADTAQRGVELTAGATGRAAHRAIPLHGAEWDWVTRAAPPANIEGATLARVLDWVERESGRHIRFAEAGLAATAATTIVHGSVEGLTPEESLGAVLATCGLRFRIQGEDIVIASNQTP